MLTLNGVLVSLAGGEGGGGVHDDMLCGQSFKGLVVPSGVAKVNHGRPGPYSSVHHAVSSGFSRQADPAPGKMADFFVFVFNTWPVRLPAQLRGSANL
jgi:hypothetical protein